jgi:hypothetical protein
MLLYTKKLLHDSYGKEERNLQWSASFIVKAIPVTGREGLWGCEKLRISRRLDNRLTVDGSLSALRTGRSVFPRNIISLLLVLRA